MRHWTRWENFIISSRVSTQVFRLNIIVHDETGMNSMNKKKTKTFERRRKQSVVYKKDEVQYVYKGRFFFHARPLFGRKNSYILSHVQVTIRHKKMFSINFFFMQIMHIILRALRTDCSTIETNYISMPIIETKIKS